MTDNRGLPPAELDYTPEGYLVLRQHRQSEPICPKCGERIYWVLDMASFTRVGYDTVMAHAHCVWLPEAFTTERKRAAELSPSQQHEV